MARLFFAILILFTALVQATILPSLNVLAVLPDTTLVLLLVWSALRGIPEGVAWAFGVGLCIDVIGLDAFGTNGLALLGVAVLGGLARRRFFHSNLIVPIVVAVFATFVHAIVLLLVRSGTGAGLPLDAVMRVIFLQALLNSIFVPPLYLIAGIMDRWVVPSHA